MKTTADQVALSVGGFASLFGKEQTWGYRQIYAGKVKTITEYGRILIPAAEVQRILGKAGTYNGLKPKVAKPGVRFNAWKQFLVERRKAKSGKQKASHAEALKRFAASGENGRSAALARLTKRSV